jgi:hypothetical protein
MGFFEKCLIAHFYWFMCFLQLSFYGSFYIMDINPFSGIYLQISSVIL